MKKLLGTIILVLVIALGAWYYLFFQKTQNTQTQQDNQNRTINIEDKKITDNTKPFAINITYPYIAGMDEFNNKANNIITKELDDFKKNSEENDKAVKDTDPESYAKYPREYDLTIGYDKGLISADVASVMFDIYNYEGGAHGANYFVPLNFNPKTQKEIQLADLFPNDKNYLKTISDYAIKDLSKQIESIDLDWINRGAGPQTENYSVFLINSSSIVFYFPEYQVASYAAGSFKVAYPRQ